MALAKIQAKYIFIMKNIIYSLAFMLISSFAFANNNLIESIIKKEITSYSINGNLLSPKEFSELDSKVIELAKECTVTIKLTVETPAGPMTFTTTETFEASWLGCLAAQVGAFLVSLLTPSIT